MPRIQFKPNQKSLVSSSFFSFFFAPATCLRVLHTFASQTREYLSTRRTPYFPHCCSDAWSNSMRLIPNRQCRTFIEICLSTSNRCKGRWSSSFSVSFNAFLLISCFCWFAIYSLWLNTCFDFLKSLHWQNVRIGYLLGRCCWFSYWYYFSLFACALIITACQAMLSISIDLRLFKLAASNWT